MTEEASARTTHKGAGGYEDLRMCQLQASSGCSSIFGKERVAEHQVNTRIAREAKLTDQV